MWKNALDECANIVHCDYDWMCCIKLSSANKDMYIINVYLIVRIITTCTWIICLKLLCLRRVYVYSTCIFIVGEINADLSKISYFGSILCDFCHDNSFTIADKEYLPASGGLTTGPLGPGPQAPELQGAPKF